MRSNTFAYRRSSSLRTRSKHVFSLLQVMAIAVASFLLLPLAVYADPASEVEATFDSPGGTRTLHCQFTGQAAFPGDTVYCRMRVGNGGQVDGSFMMWLREESFELTRCPDQGEPGVQDDFDFQTKECAGGAARVAVPKTDPRWQEFIDFWQFSMTTRPVITRSIPEERDVTYDDRYLQICEPKSLEHWDGGDLDQDTTQMCQMGVIRGLQSGRLQTDQGEPAYERQYFLGMTLRDNGKDQTEFRGWDLHFALTIRMEVPAEDTCPTTRVNGTCAMPIYQRT